MKILSAVVSRGGWAVALASSIFVGIGVSTIQVKAQTFTVLHSFSDAADGGAPYGGLTMDAARTLYGTASQGGGSNSGLVFRLVRSGSAWLLVPLYSFHGEGDGAEPKGTVIFGPDGGLYGTTSAGGGFSCGLSVDCGTVFRLRPSPTACTTALCPWNETVLYRFTGETDGGEPSGYVVFDAAGNLYGSTFLNVGNIYELTPHNGGWMESVLFPHFGSVYGAMVTDRMGDLYGATFYGGTGNCFRGGSCGTVFQLKQVGTSWQTNILYSFQGDNDGGYPVGGVIFDGAGNLYGASTCGTDNGGGAIFMLSPVNGSWAFAVLYSLSGSCGGGVGASLTMDAVGNLYGTTMTDGAYGMGSVFKLTHSNGSWEYVSLHDFTGGNDGGVPHGSVTLDASGNLYGTASVGGAYGYGTVWEITP